VEETLKENLEAPSTELYTEKVAIDGAERSLMAKLKVVQDKKSAMAAKTSQGATLTEEQKKQLKRTPDTSAEAAEATSQFLHMGTDVVEVIP